MKIETVLQDVERELPRFIEASKKTAEEETTRISSAATRITHLKNLMRDDIDKIFQRVSKFGISMNVDDEGPAVEVMRGRLDVIARMAFECDTEQIVCRYTGKEPKLIEFPTATVDYERDLLPLIANFIPYALKWQDFKWSDEGSTPPK